MNRTTFARKADKLTQKQVRAARGTIRNLSKAGESDGGIRKALLGQFASKMEEPWQAERVLRTERTRIGSMTAAAEARKEGRGRMYSVPTRAAGRSGPCSICQAKAAQGHNLSKGDLPPYHPNCKCQAH